MSNETGGLLNHRQRQGVVINDNTYTSYCGDNRCQSTSPDGHGAKVKNGRRVTFATSLSKVMLPVAVYLDGRIFRIRIEVGWGGCGGTFWDDHDGRNVGVRGGIKDRLGGAVSEKRGQQGRRHWQW